MVPDGDRAVISCGLFLPPRVTIAIRSSAEEIWKALTEPDIVRKWWGEISPPFRVGRLSQLAVGDGDLYALEIVRLEPPYHLEYGRRLFGIGAKETIRWIISAKEGGCLINVSYTVPELDGDRRCAWHEEWIDHTDRLEKCLKNESLRPSPRLRELIISTELPGGITSVRSYLSEYLKKVFGLFRNPFYEKDETTLSVRDGAEPNDVRIVTGRGDSTACSVSLELSHSTWLYPTSAHLYLRQRPQGTKLTIRHRGWEGTAFDDEDRKRQRARFARFWHRFFLRFTLEYARSWRIPTLSPADLKSRMERSRLFVYDANRTTLWERGHVPEAVFVGQEDIPLDRLPSNKHTELVFYCRDSACLTAYLSAAKARTLGYPNTFVMEGGREAWTESGFPLVSENNAGTPVREEPDTYGA